MAAEYNGSNVLQRLYVHGPGIDEALVWYEGADTSDRRWLIADQLGSIVAVTNSSGVATTINTYDEFGVPGGSNVGRFQFTGQAWLPDVNLYYYRARIYNASLGRFMQTDPILYAGGMNLYAYVGNDPLNATDPWGLQRDDRNQVDNGEGGGRNWDGVVRVTVESPNSPITPSPLPETADLALLGPRIDDQGSSLGGDDDEIVVTGRRRVRSGGLSLRGGILDTHNLCPVVEVELSSGIQFGITGRVGNLNVEALADLWSARARGGFYNGGPWTGGLHSSMGLTGGAALSGTPLSIGGRVGRDYSERADNVGAFGRIGRLYNQPVTSAPIEAFIGIGGGIAIGFGGSFRVGAVLTPRGQTCPGDTVG